jgi:hypothetical protein
VFHSMIANKNTFLIRIELVNDAKNKKEELLTQTH